MNDRELLEWAAKGHGFIDDAVDGSEAHGLHRDAEGLFYWIDANGWVPWAPADDDGQALRLAVAAKVDLQQGHWVTATVWLERSDTHFFSPKEKREEFGKDPAAATRRAIVRAAAEIGKATASAGEGGNLE